MDALLWETQEFLFCGEDVVLVLETLIHIHAKRYAKSHQAIAGEVLLNKEVAMAPLNEAPG
jgi:hypothetical protein